MITALTNIATAFMLAVLLISFVLTLHRRRKIANAGTVPYNFPPDADFEIGQLLTGSATGRTATLATTTFFTAPVPGLYMIAMALRVVSTDGTGTLAATVTLPHQIALDKTTTGGFLIDADLSVPSDGLMAAIPVWLSAGGIVQVGVVAAGLTGTTYNVFVTAQRLF